MKGASLFEARLKRLLDLEKELLGFHVVAHAQLHPLAAREGQRDPCKQDYADHLLSRRKTSNTPTKAITAAAMALNCSGSTAKPTADSRARMPL